MTLLPYAAVAVALPLPRLYHYAIPEALLSVLEVGHGVLVPFGPRKLSGFVIERTDTVDFDPAKLRPIVRLLAPDPLFPARMLPFYQWVAHYYHHPLGEVIRTGLPTGILVESRATCRLTPEGEAVLLAAPSQLSDLEKQFLSLLKQRGPQSWTRLIDKPPIPSLVATWRACSQAGWVDVSQHLESASVRPQVVDFVRPLVSQVPDYIRGAVQRQVLQSLLELGEVELDVLKATVEERVGKVTAVRAPLERLESLGLVSIEAREQFREGPTGMDLGDFRPRATQTQQQAIDQLGIWLKEGAFRAVLLQGVTGSGKTEVYLQTAQQALELGKSALILVPEIALTPQLLGRFRGRFGGAVACLHSGLTPGERFDAWRRIQRGDIQVVVGARSALFAPLPELGLVVVDEEHDPSFKQDSGLRYNARDLAVVLAQQAQAVAVLGSATPSLETMTNALQGRFSHLRLPERVAERAMPAVELVDMTRQEHRPTAPHSPLSPALEDALRANTLAGDQSILLLNRRGFAPFVLCGRCGGAFRCLHCDTSLTYHRRRHLLLCHYCGLTRSLPDTCPHCGKDALELMGQGTERLEQILEELLPGVSVLRLDRDTTSGKEGAARILDAFRAGEAQILVGTQMVVKGHDFPNVTLVGVVQADYALQLPDFRASERTFQLVTQVAGRAGRGDKPGRVIVQTYTPNHPSLTCAAHHDYERFYKQELRLRKAHGQPPFFRLALLHISALSEGLAEQHGHTLVELLRAEAHQQGQTVDVWGPTPAPLSRLQKWYRWQVLLRCQTSAGLHKVLRAAEGHPEFDPGQSELRIGIDLDPQQLL